jgi:DeoR family transcriptional regulator of aga operon
MMDQAQEVILLADSTKFGQQALVKLCEMNDVDIVVTDSELSKDHQKQIQAAGCQLIIA